MVPLRLVANKACDNLRFDLALAAARELPVAGRLRLGAAKYAAIAANRRTIRYLDHTFHYDNRLAPAMLPAYLQEIRRLDAVVNLAAARTVLDVGANVGQFGATAAWRFPDLQVWSFEPNPEAYALLQANARQVDNWHTVPFGIAATEQEVELWFVPGKSAQGSTRRENATAGLLVTNARAVRVPLQPLTTDTSARLEIPLQVDVLKVDVEGAEASALRGLAAVRWQWLALETSANRSGGLDLEAAVDLIDAIWGTRPRVAWADEVRRGAPARDVILSMPRRDAR